MKATFFFHLWYSVVAMVKASVFFRQQNLCGVVGLINNEGEKSQLYIYCKNLEYNNTDVRWLPLQQNTSQ